MWGGGILEVEVPSPILRFSRLRNAELGRAGGQLCPSMVSKHQKGSGTPFSGLPNWSLWRLILHKIREPGKAFLPLASRGVPQPPGPSTAC